MNNNKWQIVADIFGQDFTITTKDSFKQLSIARSFSANVFVALLQFIGVMITHSSANTVVWLACGTAAAFVFLRGYIVLPGIFLGMCAAFSLLQFSTISILFFSLLYTLQTLIIVAISTYYINPSPLFYKKTQLFCFILVCLLVTGGVNSLAKLFLSTNDLTNFSNISIKINLSVINEWLANGLGTYILSSAIIAWDAYFPQMPKIKKVISPLNIFLYLTVFLIVVSLFLVKNLLLWMLLAISSWTITKFTHQKYGYFGSITMIFMWAFLFNLGNLFTQNILLSSYFSKNLFLQLLLFSQTMIFIGNYYVIDYSKALKER